jgi:hypothetical protein
MLPFDCTRPLGSESLFRLNEPKARLPQNAAGFLTGFQLCNATRTSRYPPRRELEPCA